MRIDWKNFKKFIDDTSLFHYVSYLELDSETFVWFSYQNQNFDCLLIKGSQDFADFSENYKTKTVLKNEISADGKAYSKPIHVKEGRFLHAYYVVFETSTKTTNDITGFFSVKMFDENNHETDDSSKAVKTCLRFEPTFTYELYGAGIQTLLDMTEIFYASAIINPDIPSEYGGNLVEIKNKRLLLPKENVFLSGYGTAELPYTPGQHTNVMCTEISHVKAIRQQFQYEIQFYKTPC